MAKELKIEELEQVSGGSHVSASDIHNYVGRDMLFSWGALWFYEGPYSVHINSVRETKDEIMVNMTFVDSAGYKKVQEDYSGWTYYGNNTCEFDYSYGTTWLE